MDSELHVYEKNKPKSPKPSPYQVILKHGEPDYLEVISDDHHSGEPPVYVNDHKLKRDVRVSNKQDTESGVYPQPMDQLQLEDQHGIPDYLEVISDDHHSGAPPVYVNDHKLKDVQVSNSQNADSGAYLQPIGGTTNQLQPGHRHLTPLPSLPSDATAVYEEIPDNRGDHSTRGNNIQTKTKKAKAKRKRVFLIVGVTIGVLVLIGIVVILMYFLLPRDNKSETKQSKTSTTTLMTVVTESSSGFTPSTQPSPPLSPPTSSTQPPPPSSTLPTPPPQGVPAYSQASYDRAFGTSGSGQFQLRFPRGMAVTPNDQIWICDSENNKILVLDNLIQPLFDEGFIGQTPFDTTFFNGWIYVTSYGTNQIYIYDQNRTLQNITGSEGSGLGQFNEPWGITSGGNKLYISDRLNKRIQVFENGAWSQFGEGEFSNQGPTHIAVTKDQTRFAVSDLNANLYILNSSYHITHRFESGQPPLRVSVHCLTFDRYGNLIICDATDNTIVVLDRDYKIIARIGAGIFGQPSGIVLTQSGHLVVSDQLHDGIHLFTVPLAVP